MGNKWLKLFESKTLAKVFENKYAFSFSAKAKQQIENVLHERLYNYAIFVFDSELKDSYIQLGELFSLYPKLVTEEQKELLANELINKWASAGINAFDSSVPGFREKLELICLNFENAFTEMFERLESNIKLLQDFSEIKDISCEGSDVHNNGRVTTIIYTDKNRFVYKPHDCRMDVQFKKLIESYYPSICKIPLTVAIRDEYGFCEYIDNCPASSDREAELFYRNTGSVMALFTFLGASDFHYENFLACKSLPVPIDLEMVVSPQADKKYALHCNEEFCHSCFSTGILPFKLNTFQSSLLLNTDSKSMPCIENEKVTVSAYLNSFKEGFKETYLYSLKMKKELISWLKGLNDIKQRKLIRNTFLYQKCLNILSNKKYFLSENERNTVLKQFDKFNGNEISAAEKKALSVCDIPYFYFHLNGKALFSSDGLVEKQYFRQSAIETVERVIENRDEKNLDFDLSIIDRLFELSEKADSENPTFEEIEKNIIKGPSGYLYYIRSSEDIGPHLEWYTEKQGNLNLALTCALCYKSSKDQSKRERSLRLCETLVKQMYEDLKTNLADFSAWGQNVFFNGFAKWQKIREVYSKICNLLGFQCCKELKELINEHC